MIHRVRVLFHELRGSNKICSRGEEEYELVKTSETSVFSLYKLRKLNQKMTD